MVSASSDLGIAALVVAAGRGERAAPDGDIPKQFRPLAGTAVLTRSVARVIEAGCSPVVAVVPADQVDTARALLAGFPDVKIVSGGATRQQSVAAGLREIDAAKVLVHDGARPLASVALMRRVAEALNTHRAVVPGVPIEDTVKKTEDGRVSAEVDRASLVAVQTPQGFETAVLRTSHERAASEGYVATDDGGLVAHYGVGVSVVPGERSNIKLTYPADFEFAEALLGSEP